MCLQSDRAHYGGAGVLKMFFMYSFLVASFIGAQNPISPCPGVFQYHYDGSRWMGRLTVHRPPRAAEIKVNISLALRVQLTNKYLGSLNLDGGRANALTRLYNGDGLVYNVDFPVQSPLARPTLIVVNNEVLCRAPPEPGALTLVRLEHLLYTSDTPAADNVELYQRNEFPRRRPKLQSRFSDDEDTVTEPPKVQRPKKTTSRRLVVSKRPTVADQYDDGRPQPVFNQKEIACGRALPAVNSLVVGGNPNERGRQPWLVATYSQLAGNLHFRCGATLVSKKLVITAAHCLVDDRLQRTLRPEEIVLFLGRFNIKSWSETDYLSRDLERLIVHEDYKARSEASYDADIGLMIMRKPAVYSQYIRPICLWSGSTDLDVVTGQEGTVTGWGRTNDGDDETVPTPRTIRVPIVSNKVCLAENESFRYLTSSRTFCAGHKDGTGPCNGDSGGGLIITRKGRSFLRGIVSASLRDPTTGLCNLNSYVVFTDVAKFSDFIEPHL